MSFDDNDLKRLKEKIKKHPNLCVPFDEGRTITFESLLARLEAAESFKGLMPIEIQSIVDAMLYTQENTITSDAHVRAFKKIKAWRKAAGK